MRQYTQNIRLKRSYYPFVGGHQGRVTAYTNSMTYRYEVKQLRRQQPKRKTETEQKHHLWSNRRGRTLSSGRASLKHPSFLFHLTLMRKSHEVASEHVGTESRRNSSSQTKSKTNRLRTMLRSSSSRSSSNPLYPRACTAVPFFFHFPASGQAVVTGVVPSPPRFLPSIFIAHRVQQSHCSSISHRVLPTHALALSASQLVRKKKSQRICTSMHSAGLELTKLTYTRLEDNLIRHRGDRDTLKFEPALYLNE